jgi:hypothetical protein
MAEFVVDLLCTGRMSEVEYREFVVATLESLSANLMKSWPRCAPGLARAAAEEMTAKRGGSGTMKTLCCCTHERLRELHAGSDQGRRDDRGVERARRA